MAGSRGRGSRGGGLQGGGGLGVGMKRVGVQELWKSKESGVWESEVRVVCLLILMHRHALKWSVTSFNHSKS